MKGYRAITILPLAGILAGLASCLSTTAAAPSKHPAASRANPLAQLAVLDVASIELRRLTTPSAPSSLPTVQDGSDVVIPSRPSASLRTTFQCVLNEAGKRAVFTALAQAAPRDEGDESFPISLFVNIVMRDGRTFDALLSSSLGAGQDDAVQIAVNGLGYRLKRRDMASIEQVAADCRR